MNSENKPPPISALVIDDEPQIRTLLKIALEAAGYRVSAAGTGEEGLAVAATRPHEIIILDLGLPGVSGLSVLIQLRQWSSAPVLILTVRDTAAEKIEALDNGADDYITKPFNTEELLARVRAMLRRSLRSDSGDSAVVRLGDIEVNLASREISRHGEPVKITATEFSLLRYFIKHSGKVLTHRQILREVWGPEHELETQYLRVYMTRLREKLEKDPAEPTLFLTQPGVGYRLAED